MISATGISIKRLQSTSRGGFTLVEVLLVVAVMGLLVGVAVPRLSGTLDAARMKSTAADIVRTAQLARAKARSAGKICEMVFDQDTRSYGLRFPSEVSTAGWISSDRGDVGLVAGGRISEEIQVTWDEPWVRFFPDGGAERLLVVLESSRGICLDVTIEEHREYVTRCD